MNYRDQEYSQQDQEMIHSILSTITDKQKRIAIETIYKDPSVRKKQEIQQLIESTSSLPFFDGYIQAGQADIHSQCCRRMKLEVASKGQIVFQVGEYGQQFYLILHGSVSVSIKMPGQQHQMSLRNQINVTDENLENMINLMNSNNTNVLNNQNNYNSQGKGRSEIIGNTPRQPQVQMLQVAILKEGSQFGEMALLNNQPRLATIQCQEDCIFAILGKKDFKEILKKNEEEKLHKEMCYLSSLPFFASWNINQLKNLFLNSRKNEYVRDQYIFKEGDQIDGVYIIKQGHFQQSKKFTRLQDIDGLNLDADEIKIFDENEHLNKFDVFEKDMQICILDEKTIIGEEDIIKNNSKRTFSVKCTSLTGHTIRIDKNEFQYRVMLEESSKVSLLKQLEIKDQALSKRIYDIKSRLSQFQNYFYQNSKHKEYLRYKIESQSSKLFQNNTTKKSNLRNSKTIYETQEDSKIKRYANSPFTLKEFTSKTTIPSQISSFSEAIKPDSQNKRMIRSFSSSNYFKVNTTQSHSEPVENYKKNFMQIYKSQSPPEQASICDQEIPSNQITQQVPPTIFKQENVRIRPVSSSNLTNYKQEKKTRSISSNEINIFQIMKTSIQNQKLKVGQKEDGYSNEIILHQRQKPLEETQRPRLLYGNIEQTIKVNFKKVFQKKLREKGTNTEVKEIPTWNKVSMSFANQVLVYSSSDTLHKQRAMSARKKQDYETLLETAYELTRDLKKIPAEKEEEVTNISKNSNNSNICEIVKQKIAEQEAKRKLIRSSSNPKRLIKVMRNFQSSQQNAEQSRLVEYSIEDLSELKESCLKSVDYNTISRIHYSPKKTTSQFKSSLKIKKK